MPLICKWMERGGGGVVDRGRLRGSVRGVCVVTELGGGGGGGGSF